jgi:alginate O-acetyltransferase complex protein AlgI
MLTFNFYYNGVFWLFFLAILIIFRLLSFNPKIKELSLLISSALMLLALPRFNLITLLLLLIVSSVTFLIGYTLQQSILIKSKKERIFAAVIGIVGVIMFLSFFKYPFFQNLILKDKSIFRLGAPDFIFFIGISYFSFRMMHFIIESYKQKISTLNIVNYVNYILFFPAFISGPINRYNHFCEQFNPQTNTPLKDDLKNGIERIVHGLFKKIVLAGIIYPYILTNIGKPINEMTTYEVAYGIYAYTLYFYFDFAGYTDMAIGAARVLGIGLPENFNKPFLKRNIQQLWANWHISLTGWLTDYIYWPLVRKMRNIITLKKHPILLSNICILITFIVCGMWHGETLNFVLWGIYHGIGISVVNIYQNKKRKIKNEFLRKYFTSKYSQLVGIFATFNFFAIGLLLFALDINEVIMLF